MRIAVVGAGPCGLACARELQRLGHSHWVVFEREAFPGGNASSLVDPAGFTWDYGGHVVFSHFGEFDRLLDEVMGEEFLQHDRSSFVRVADQWIPYPFQNNLHRLPRAIAEECLNGLIAASANPTENANFSVWMNSVFGQGITRHFMRPYNRKVWATDPDEMSASWIAERVSVPDIARAKRNFELRQDDHGWGPNSTFKFPIRGGTGEIFRRLAQRLASGIRFESKVVAVDNVTRLITLSSGEQEPYDALVSTMPIDQLVACIRRCPHDVRDAARTLRHNSAAVVGVGFEQPLGDDRSWLYFPGPETPFYRATNFAKYSPENVPRADTSRYSSYMTETSFAPGEAGLAAGLEGRVVEALANVGLSARDAGVASVHRIDIEYAYPIPTLERDTALSTIQTWLEGEAIYSRGRFGSWRYEVGNMDHAVKMGVDVAHRIVEDKPEEIHPA